MQIPLYVLVFGLVAFWRVFNPRWGRFKTNEDRLLRPGAGGQGARLDSATERRRVRKRGETAPIVRVNHRCRIFGRLTDVGGTHNRVRNTRAA